MGEREMIRLSRPSADPGEVQKVCLRDPKAARQFGLLQDDDGEDDPHPHIPSLRWKVPATAFRDLFRKSAVGLCCIPLSYDGIMIGVVVFPSPFSAIPDCTFAALVDGRCWVLECHYDHFDDTYAYRLTNPKHPEKSWFDDEVVCQSLANLTPLLPNESSLTASTEDREKGT